MEAVSFRLPVFWFLIGGQVQRPPKAEIGLMHLENVVYFF